MSKGFFTFQITSSFFLSFKITAIFIHVCPIYILIGMRNLCVSCSLVCIILLSSCLIVFMVGFAQKQVPPIVIVSVLYILAGNLILYPISNQNLINYLLVSFLLIFYALLFIFTAFFGSLALTIIRFRRYQCNSATPQHQNTNVVKTSFTTNMDGAEGGYDATGDCLSGIGGFEIDKKVSEEFHSAIYFHSSWSFYLGWLGICGCVCSSICVFTLSKLMRNGPLFAT